MSSLHTCPKWKHAMMLVKKAGAEGASAEPSSHQSPVHPSLQRTPQEYPAEGFPSSGKRKNLRDNWVTEEPTPKEVPNRPVPKSFRQKLKQAEAEGDSSVPQIIMPPKHWVSTSPSDLPEPRRYYEAPPAETEKPAPKGLPGPVMPGRGWMKVMPSTVEIPLTWGLPKDRRPAPKAPQEPQLPEQAAKPPFVLKKAPIPAPKPAHRTPQQSYPSNEEMLTPSTRPQTQGPAEVNNDPFFKSNKIYSLNMDNFQQFIREKDVALIMFYDPRNSSVFFSKDHFSQASEKAKRQNHAFAAVDCSKEDELCKWEDTLQEASNPVFKLYSYGDLVAWYRNFHTFNSKLMAKYVDFCPVKGSPPCE